MTKVRRVGVIIKRIEILNHQRLDFSEAVTETSVCRTSLKMIEVIGIILPSSTKYQTVDIQQTINPQIVASAITTIE
jgi:hypothetical protein